MKWTIAQHFAEPARVDVHGASFGGCSATMTVVQAPKIFKCTIGYAGIHDLAMMYKKGDIRMEKSSRNYLNLVIGASDADLDANSPDKLAAKIDVPVLLIHGEDDQRAPFAQAKAMRAALEKAGNAPQWLAKDHEGHGFYDEKNNVEALDTIAAFLKANIGAGAPIQP